VVDRTVAGMAFLRLASSIIELSAALFILRLNRVEAGLRINAVLGLVGPLIFLSVSALGIFALAGKVPSHRLAFIAVGVLLILLGTR